MTRFALPSILILVWLSPCAVASAQREDRDSAAPNRGAACDSDTNQVSADACPGDVSQPPVVTDAWNHPINLPCYTSVPERHRSVDVVFRPGQEQWLAGKFAYGLTECDLDDEMVEIWIRTSCGVWELFGSVLTSVGSGTVFHGIEDDGGRAFFTIPADKRLGPGSYPVQMVVKGDGTKANSWLHVWEPGTKAVISDIDGTLTTLEHETLWSALDPTLPEARPRSAELLQLFQSKGYRVVYLTARTESLTNGTRAWLASKGFPIDVLHTSQTLLVETAGPAFDFKQAFMMDLIQNTEVVADWAYGNKESDLLAYLDAGVTPSHVYLVEGSYTGDLMGANSLSDFGPEVDRVMCLAPVNRFSIFADGFESGGATAWSSSVGVSP